MQTEGKNWRGLGTRLSWTSIGAFKPS